MLRLVKTMKDGYWETSQARMLLMLQCLCCQVVDAIHICVGG